MPNASTFASILAGLADGSVVPYLGCRALDGVIDPASGRAIPADSDSLILAMNDGKPMAPKLMYEFPRAAMNIELKRGRKAVTKFLDRTYRDTVWSTSALHTWLAQQNLPYIIDSNRDLLLQNAYAGKPHTLIVGLARIGGTDYRFKLFQSDGAAYREIAQEMVDVTLPILFKPLGSPVPESHYIASDADFVDYVTELMGGFGIPAFRQTHAPGQALSAAGPAFDARHRAHGAVRHRLWSRTTGRLGADSECHRQGEALPRQTGHGTGAGERFRPARRRWRSDQCGARGAGGCLMLTWKRLCMRLALRKWMPRTSEFTALVNLLGDCDDAEFAALFEKLLEHCRLHFTSEGRLMRISRFPALNEHEGEHHRIYGDLVQMNRAVQRGRLLLPRAFVKQGLEEWFSVHLSTMDAALAAHLQRVGSARVDMSGGLPVLM
jgi:hemerythrin